MNKKLRDKWIKALRGTTYKQGKCHLEVYKIPGEKPEHCCLGVLCRVARLKGERQDRNEIHTTWDGDGGLLSADLLTRFKINHDHMTALINMNDGIDQKSFPEIADWIEVNIPVEEAV